MNKKKLTIISVALIMVLAVGGVLAYLTSTASVTNTFTVGDVEITLDETAVNPDGTPVVDENGAPVDRVTENEYHLLPGQTYIKDPTITVLKGSEESYVRMILTVTNKSAVDAVIAAEKNGLTDYADLFDGWDDTKWVYEGFDADDDADTISFEFRYSAKVAADETDDLVLEPLFTELVVPEFVNGDELEALQACTVVVNGDAIQAVGFEDVVDEEGNVTKTAEDAAWEAFDAQAEAENK